MHLPRNWRGPLADILIEKKWKEKGEMSNENYVEWVRHLDEMPYNGHGPIESPEKF